ncbi:MAG: DUF1570 domain-containing protein [Planctomycetes bacterium]|nr:DUF1570 domain-containing protein [Planctomycetota bacterium]
MSVVLTSFRRLKRNALAFLFLLGVMHGSGAPAVADLFTVQEDDGNKVTIEARLAGEGQGVVALERTDGRIEVVPLGQILKRQPAPDPDPMTPAAVMERLAARFGRDKFRGHADSTYVIGLVLSEPLPKKYEAKAALMLKTGTDFMKLVEKEFLEFIDDVKVEIVKPRYPLVLLIFETDDDFIKYTEEESGGRGLSATNILGYYSGLTNHLVVRMSECSSFSTPLHEAIHQQVYNRGVLHRLSPAPAWFNEGIATGFEGGERINTGPLKVNARYARKAVLARNVNWDDVVADDRAFHGDVLAGEAYANAWSIHWFLLTRYRKQYIEYLQLLGQKQTLQKDDAQTRIDDFERVFGKRIGKLQSEFPQALEVAANKQKVSLEPAAAPGYLVTVSNLAEVGIAAARAGNGPMQAEGWMRNLSHLRPMSFHITVETDSGQYAEWFLPNVAPSKNKIPLGKQVAQKQMANSPGGPSSTFVIRVSAVVPDSESGQKWKRGQLPVPDFQQ